MSSCQQHLSQRRARSFDAWKIVRAAAPAAVALLGSFWLAGCDTPANQDDRKVQADVVKARAALASGDQSSAVAARKALEQAAADTAPTSLTRAFAKSSLAEVEQNAASRTMLNIDQDDAKLDRLVWEIGQLAQQIDASRAVASSYDKYDPKPAHDAIAADIAAAQSGPATPNLSAVAQTISQLQDQIKKQGDDLKSLQDQRTQALDEADQADKSSEISKGQQSVDDFKRAADLRKQAGDLTVQIEKNQAQTIPIQKDLEVAQGQQTVLQETVQQLQDQSQSLDAGWKSVQGAVAAQAALQNQIATGASATPGGDTAAPAAVPDAAAVAAPATGMLSPTAGQSLSDKADALGKLVQSMVRERSDALSDLNSAIQHYRDAAMAAKDFFAALDLKIKDPANAKRPEINGWTTLQAVAHPAAYQLKEALAQRQLAGLYVSQIDNDTRRAELQDEVSKILGQVNIPVPAALNDTDLDNDKKNSGEAALAAYASADKAISDMKHGSVPDTLRKIARVEYVLTLYGQVQLARAMGDASTAQDKLTQTTSERDDVLHDGLQLPPLPAEITPALTAPAAPTATPAT